MIGKDKNQFRYGVFPGFNLKRFEFASYSSGFIVLDLINELYPVN